MKMAVFWLSRRVVWQKFTDVSEVFAASTIWAMMKAACTSEASVTYWTTQRNNPEDKQSSNASFIMRSVSNQHQGTGTSFNSCYLLN
jgi:hypothetical protein